MVSTVAITLSSSPPREPKPPAFSTSSPSESSRRRPQLLPSGKSLAPIPKDAILTFTSAATLLQRSLPARSNTTSRQDGKSSEDIFDIESVLDSEPLGVGQKHPSRGVTQAIKGDSEIFDLTEAENARRQGDRKNDQDTNEEKESTKTSKRPRAKRLNAVDVEEQVVAKRQRQPRAKKNGAETQTKLPKGKVIKATVTSKDTAGKELNEFEPASRHFLSEPKEETVLAEPLALGLEQAIARKREWTPPSALKDSSSISAPPSLDLSQESPDSGPVRTTTKACSFQELLGNFEYVKSRSILSDKQCNNAGSSERKLFDEVVEKESLSSTVASGAKSKPAQKRIKTITGHATAAYIVEAISPSQDRELPCLPVNKDSVADKPKSLPGKRSRSPTKSTPKPKPSKARKGTAAAPILLSPESALKQANKQDFVFGTSSQLAREDSPTLLRDLHAAMQASNIIDNDSFEDYASEATGIDEHGLGTTHCRGNLWSAATRDSSGQLLGIETVDLANSPGPEDKTNSRIIPANNSKITNVDGDWHDIDQVETPLISRSVPSMTDRSVTIASGVEIETDPKSTRSEADLSPVISTRNCSTELLISETASNVDVQNPTANISSTSVPERPNYASYTTAELAKELAAYRFKPLKSRDQMITLLGKCWESKQRVALGNLGTNSIITPSTTTLKNQQMDPSGKMPETMAPPKKPRGRPRKPTQPAIVETSRSQNSDSNTPPPSQRTPKKSTPPVRLPVDVDEIYDPEPLTPSPPRRRPVEIRTPPLSLPLSTQKDHGDGSERSAELAQKELFTHITRAIRDAPHSKDPLNPSWHEKILLYDPIILEDLTTWLNTGALEKVGWDGEVAPLEVKKWCESKSICCLWKANLRGGVRSRY